MIKQTMNIGCLCEGHIFTDLFEIRIKGPVDNFEGYNFKSTLNIFNGKLFDAILSDKIDNKEIYKNEDNDGFIRYYCSDKNVIWDNNGHPIFGNYGFKTIHNNFEDNKYKEFLKDRINNFNRFNNNLTKDSYYIYTISPNDQFLSLKDFNYTINNLPSYVIDKLIIISAVRYDTPKLFYENFRCINYNNDFSGEHKIPKVDWDIVLT